MVQMKPRLPSKDDLKDGSINFVFMGRTEGRHFDKDKQITVSLTSHHLGQFLVFDDCGTFSLSAPSETPHHPVKIVVEQSSEEGKILLKASQGREPEDNSVAVEASRGDFKVMQVLIQSIIPQLFRWGPESRASLSESDKKGSFNRNSPPLSAAQFFRS